MDKSSLVATSAEVQTKALVATITTTTTSEVPIDESSLVATAAEVRKILSIEPITATEVPIAYGRTIACGNTSGCANATDLGNANGDANDIPCRTDRGGTGRTSHDFRFRIFPCRHSNSTTSSTTINTNIRNNTPTSITPTSITQIK